jgi:hypothetical protein
MIDFSLFVKNLFFKKLTRGIIQKLAEKCNGQAREDVQKLRFFSVQVAEKFVKDWEKPVLPPVPTRFRRQAAPAKT